jgi:phage shock protein PspC (stress-responsive transcriptional regulator)
LAPFALLSREITLKFTGGEGDPVKGQSVAHALHARLTEEGLKRVITKTLLINRLDIDELSPDDLARLITIEPLKMSRGGRVTVRAAKAAKKSRRRQNYWTRVKKEIHILICTNDRKYATLRRQFTKGKSQTALVTMICGGIAEYIGGSSTVIMPLVAVALLIFLEVGINAYCAGASLRSVRRVPTRR